MFTRRHILLSGAAVPFFTANCRAQSQSQSQAPMARPNLYACEGCDGVFDRSHDNLPNIIYMAPDGEPGERLVLSGVVYKPDGKTPAKNVVLYFYHTDAAGLYSRGTEQSQWSRRHGLLRGWLKTGADGYYEVRTIKPGAYPNLGAPAHIHPTVLEPGRQPYWIDDVVFEGEFGVTEAYKFRRPNRGGNGVVTLIQKGGEWRAERNIILERHPK